MSSREAHVHLRYTPLKKGRPHLKRFEGEAVDQNHRRVLLVLLRRPLRRLG